LVFRDAKTSVSAESLVEGLGRHIGGIHVSHGHVLDALIRAGELECGLSDRNAPAARLTADLTDCLSALLVAPELASVADVQRLFHRVIQGALPASLTVSPPEGFAYYALHPLDFVELALQTKCDDCPAAVIGIRSIGTVLSAVFTAGLKKRGCVASRITVRPVGHPYGRTTKFSQEQLELLHNHGFRGSRFYIVDEGPGLSGSSFLSVAEALIKQGIPTDRISLIGTREADPAALCAQGAEDRWRRFQHQTVKSSFYERCCQGTVLSGGAWRGVLLKSGQKWPPCWPQMERVKFLSPDARFLLKFDGLGRFGEEVQQRVDCLYRAGMCPSVQDAGNGLSAYVFVPGCPLERSEVSVSIIERMATYCAIRAREVRATCDSGAGVAEMLRHNLQQELNVSFDVEAGLLQTSSPVFADGHMQPEEWISTPRNELFKVDAGTHGDDHFMPGPIDIAWDLAGAVVEWNLGWESQELLANNFRRLSGDDPSKRLSLFVLAYAAYRLAYCKMASLAMKGSQEQHRWQQGYEFYRKRVIRELSNSSLNLTWQKRA
jgi:hypothetical protein